MSYFQVIALPHLFAKPLIDGHRNRLTYWQSHSSTVSIHECVREVGSIANWVTSHANDAGDSGLPLLLRVSNLICVTPTGSFIVVSPIILSLFPTFAT